jgi:hypothetical protein
MMAKNMHPNPMRIDGWNMPLLRSLNLFAFDCYKDVTPTAFEIGRVTATKQRGNSFGRKPKWNELWQNAGAMKTKTRIHNREIRKTHENQRNVFVWFCSRISRGSRLKIIFP